MKTTALDPLQRRFRRWIFFSPSFRLAALPKGRIGRVTTTHRNGIEMASDLSFVEYVVDQLDENCAVTHKRMFGEFGLFSDGKCFGLICDNRLFVKPTVGGRAYIEDVVEAPPYPGAKPSFLIEDQLEDATWLSELVRITTRELPVPKPKKRKKQG